MTNDRDVLRPHRSGLRPHHYALPIRQSAADPSVSQSEAHKTVREAQEGSVVKSWEDGLAAMSGAEDLRNVGEALMPKDSHHA